MNSFTLEMGKLASLDSHGCSLQDAARTIGWSLLFHSGLSHSRRASLRYKTKRKTIRKELPPLSQYPPTNKFISMATLTLSLWHPCTRGHLGPRAVFHGLLHDVPPSPSVPTPHSFIKSLPALACKIATTSEPVCLPPCSLNPFATL